jgi:hypothetical protein
MTELPNGCRLIQSDIGPVIPVIDIEKLIGYSRSAINAKLKEHEDKIRPCETFVPLPTGRGNQRFRCLNRTGVNLLLAYIHPSKDRMSDDEYLALRSGILDKMGNVMAITHAPAGICPPIDGARELDEVVSDDLHEAAQIAAITGTDPKLMQAAALRRHKNEMYDAFAEVLERQALSVRHGEPGWYNPSGLVELCGDPHLTADRLNKWLENYREDGEWKPFQYREGKLWRLTRRGMEHGREYQYNLGNGHSEPRISWRESVLYACGLKRDIAPDQTALPARAGR